LYEVIIYTNIKELPEIHLQVEDLNSEEFKEITQQPYVAGVKAEKIKTLTKKI
jgi:hypothetical protein